MKLAIHVDGPIGSPFRGLLATTTALTAWLGLWPAPSLTYIVAHAGDDQSDLIAQAMFIAMAVSCLFLVAQCFIAALRVTRWAFVPFWVLGGSYLILTGVTHNFGAGLPLTLYYLALSVWALWGGLAAQEVRN